jgi:hypothetical protein
MPPKFDSYHGLGSRRRRTLDRLEKAALQGSGPFSKSGGVNSATAKHHTKAAARILAAPPPTPPPPPRPSRPTWTPLPPPRPSKASSILVHEPLATGSSSVGEMLSAATSKAPPPRCPRAASPSPEYDPFEVDMVEDVAINMACSLARVSFVHARHAQEVVQKLANTSHSTKIGGFQLERVEPNDSEACVIYLLFNGDLSDLEPVVIKDFIDSLFE